MIERLYFEQRGDGCYNVTCNDYFVPVANNNFDGAIEILTHSHRDECAYPDDIAGVRVGYKALDLVGVAYGGEVRVVPEFQRERVAQRLMEAVDCER